MSLFTIIFSKKKSNILDFLSTRNHLLFDCITFINICTHVYSSQAMNLNGKELISIVIQSVRITRRYFVKKIVKN